MGNKNFMQAGTEIGALIEEREESLRKIANILSSAIVTRIKSGNSVTNLSAESAAIIKDLSTEEQVKVLLMTIDNMGKTMKVSTKAESGRNKATSTYLDDIFGSRR